MVFAVKGLEDFLSDRKQRFAVNCQCSTCIDIHARTFVIYSQNLVGGPVLIQIHDLSNDVNSKCKLFADDTSLFSVVQGIDTSANDLNHDLEKTSEWGFQQKLKFNPDSTKQA